MWPFKKRSSHNVDGTSRAERFGAERYPILTIPFHSTMVTVMVRQLTQAQISACGEFSLIETFQDKIRQDQMRRKSNAPKQVGEYLDRQHEIVRRSLVKPTYDEILKELKGEEVLEAQGKLDELENRLHEMNPGPKRSELENEISLLRLWAQYLLPSDFLSHIVSFALGVDRSDIKEISESTLIQAAVLAERGHNNPSDHIEGQFTAFMRDDINRRAWMLLDEKREEMRPKDKRHGR